MAPAEGQGLMMMFSIRIIEWHGEGYSCREAWTSQLILHQNSQQAARMREDTMQIMRVNVFTMRMVSVHIVS